MRSPASLSDKSAAAARARARARRRTEAGAARRNLRRPCAAARSAAARRDHAPAADGITVDDHRAHDAAMVQALRPLRRAGPRRGARVRPAGSDQQDPKVIEAYLGKKWIQIMLRIEGMHVGYGGIPALQDVSLRSCEGRDSSRSSVRTARAKRPCSRPSPASCPRQAAGSRSKARICWRVAPSDRAHLRHRARAGGPAGLPVADRAENLEMGAYTDAGRGAWKQNLERIHDLVPDARAAREATGRHAVGRGAADARDLARLGVLAASLMLDEPSMGLSPIVADEIFDRIVEIHRDREAERAARRAARRRIARIVRLGLCARLGANHASGPTANAVARQRISHDLHGYAAVPQDLGGGRSGLTDRERRDFRQRSQCRKEKP